MEKNREIIKKAVEETSYKYSFDEKELTYIIPFKDDKNVIVDIKVILKEKKQRINIISPNFYENVRYDEGELNKYIIKKNTFDIIFGSLGIVSKEDEPLKIIYTHSISLIDHEIRGSELREYIKYALFIRNDIISHIEGTENEKSD